MAEPRLRIWQALISYSSKAYSTHEQDYVSQTEFVSVAITAYTRKAAKEAATNMSHYRGHDHRVRKISVLGDA